MIVKVNDGEQLAASAAGTVVQAQEIGDAIAVQLVSSEHGFDDYDVTGCEVHRVTIPHGIKHNEMFNVYGPGSAKRGGTWQGTVEASIKEFLSSIPSSAAARYIMKELDAGNDQWAVFDRKDNTYWSHDGWQQPDAGLASVLSREEALTMVDELVGEAESAEAADEFPQIIVEGTYEFYAEMQQEERPPHERMRNYTSQTVTVLEELLSDDAEGSKLFKVRAADGREFEAFEEELNGWNKALGQYFWPDGTYGPGKDKTYLSNERK